MERNSGKLFVIAGLASTIIAKLVHRYVVRQRDRQVDNIDTANSLPTASRISLLTLPAEIRVQVYSYLLPTIASIKTTRALPAICRLMNDEVGKEVLRACQKRMVELNTMFGTNALLPANIRGTYTVDMSSLSGKLMVDLHVPLVYPSIHPFLGLECVVAATGEVSFAFRTFLQSLQANAWSVRVLLVPSAGIPPITSDVEKY